MNLYINTYGLQQPLTLNTLQPFVICKTPDNFTTFLIKKMRGDQYLNRIFLLQFLFCCNFCLAQTNFSSYTISKLTPDDGLSQGSNYFRFEDSKGFMWLTCNDAINRYDGKMVKVYNLDTYFKDCPSLQQGYGFAEDLESNIYIGSTKGLYIYNRKQDNFTLQKIFKNAADDVAMPIDFKDGKIWCFNRQFQLATYDIVTKKIIYQRQIPIPALNSVHIYQILSNPFYFHYPFIDNQNNIWLMASNSIACYNIETKNISFPINKFVTENKCTIFSSDYDHTTNTVFFGTQNSIIKYFINTAEIVEIKSVANKNLGRINDLVVSENLVVLCDGSANGLCITNKNFDTAFWVEPEGKNKYIRCTRPGFDKSNRLWVCDDGQGQIIFDFKGFILNKEPNDYSAVKYFETNGVGFFAQLPDHNILVQSVIVQNHQTKILSRLPIKFPGNSRYHSVTDNVRKGVWFFEEFGSSKYLPERIYFYDAKNKLLPFFKEKTIDTLGVQHDMEVLADGQVIAAFSSGVYWLNFSKRRLERVKELPQSGPFKINKLSQNDVAISYINNDLILATVQADNHLSNIKKILPGVQSFYIQQDNVRNKYWVGTDKGIYLLDEKFNTIKIFDANNGLAGTYIYGLLLDNDGNAWCSHQRGLSSIGTLDFKIVNYDKNDGIQDWDFNNRSFYKATDGTLYFGGVKGFNYFKPPLKPFTFYEPELYLDQILVNNKNYLADTNANLINELNLKFYDNNISIKAIVKDLGNAGIRQIIYRITEQDTLWKYLPNNSLLAFSSLAPGSYTLQLGTYDKFSGKNKIQKEIRIIIATPFYQQAWFYITFGIIFGGIILALYSHQKLTKHRRLFQQQLAMEHQRKNITADLHDDIGASLSSLQVNSAVANQLINRDVVQAKLILHKIETQSKDLADKMGDIIWSMKPGKEESMPMSSRIKNFAHDILSATNIDYTIQIDKEVDTLIQDIISRKNIVFITKEAINNAVKYSGASHLFIQLTKRNDMVLLTIADNGIGFNNSLTAGNGISNMHKRTKEINGSLNIISEENKGTSITAQIPIVP